MADEQRAQELETQKAQENKDQEMGNEDLGPHGHEVPTTPTRVPVPGSPEPADSPLGMEVHDEVDLEAAPPRRPDIRVSLGPRDPAV